MSLNAKINKIAKATGRPAQQVHREFYLQRFLGRVFADPDSPWVLKGGTGLLVRMDGARYSRDADLLRTDVEAAAATDDLQRLCDQPTTLDPFTFQIQRSPKDPGVGEAAQLEALVYYGAMQMQKFPIDLSIRTTLAAEIDYVVPRPVLDLTEEVLGELPRFRCLSLADQVSDKVSAMYEVHGINATPSTRWHDLVDLLLIITRFSLSAAKTALALQIQQQRRRERLTLPAAIGSPGPQWEHSYPTEAAASSLPQHLHRLDTALAALGACLDPLLDGSRQRGQWDPGTQQWTDR